MKKKRIRVESRKEHAGLEILTAVVMKSLSSGT
jgi:hypothetical protein